MILKQTRGTTQTTTAPAVAAPPARPGMMDKVRLLAHAMLRWRRAGYRLVSRALRRERVALCHACPHWNPAGNLGLGECGAPGCGCTKFKAYLASERCPLTPPRWTAAQ